MSHGLTTEQPLDTDVTLAFNSDYLAASQKATKAYVDNKLHNSLSGLNIADYQHLTAAELARVPPATTAAGDFLVGDGADAWVKKTRLQALNIITDIPNSTPEYVLTHDTFTNWAVFKPNVLTAAQALDLTDGGATTLHSHAGGSGGLTHPQIMARISIGF
jgi:hypothetical protein